MPIIQVHMMEGRDDQQKEQLIAELTEAVVNSLGAPRDSVRVLLNEMPKSHWGIAGKSARALGR